MKLGNYFSSNFKRGVSNMFYTMGLPFERICVYRFTCLSEYMSSRIKNILVEGKSS